MTDTESGGVTIEATFRNEGEGLLRSVMLGYEPIVLIEPEIDDNDNVTFKIDATGIDADDLATILTTLGNALVEAD